MEEDSVRRILGSLLGALYFRRLPRRLPISLLKSNPDLKNMYIKPKSEKTAYHIKKTFKWLKNRENE